MSGTLEWLGLMAPRQQPSVGLLDQLRPPPTRSALAAALMGRRDPLATPDPVENARMALPAEPSRYGATLTNRTPDTVDGVRPMFGLPQQAPVVNPREEARTRMMVDALSGISGGTAIRGGVRAYHSSPNAFDRFDIGRAGSTTDAGDLGRGVYFTTDGKSAMSAPFAGPGTSKPHRYEVNLNISNPLDITYPQWGANKQRIVRDALQLPPNATAAEVAEEAQRRGFDSVRLDYSPVNYNANEIAVFNDAQIEILRRYGILPPAVGAGAAVATGEEQ